MVVAESWEALENASLLQARAVTRNAPVRRMPVNIRILGQICLLPRERGHPGVRAQAPVVNRHEPV